MLIKYLICCKTYDILKTFSILLEKAFVLKAELELDFVGI